MPAWVIPAAISGISALAGLFSNRNKTSQQQSTTDQSGVQDTWLQQFMDQYTDTSRSQQGQETPTMDPLQAAMRDRILQAYSNRMMEDPNLRGYAGAGLKDINTGADLKMQALQGLLSRSGLSHSAVAANAQGGLMDRRIGDATNFLSGIPLLARDQQLKDLSAFGQFFSSLPTGRATSMTGYDSSRTTGVNTNFGQNRTTGTSTTKGTATQQGDPWAGFFAGLGSGLAPALGSIWGNKYGYDNPYGGKP